LGSPARTVVVFESIHWVPFLPYGLFAAYLVLPKPRPPKKVE